MKRLGLLFLVLGLLTAHDAAAQGPLGLDVDSGGKDGLLNAVSFKQLPAQAAIAVRVMDNSDDNLVLQAEFERVLRAKGHRVAEDASLILTFETRKVAGAWADEGRRTLVELHGGGGVGDEEAKVTVNLFNSRQGGVLNKGERSGTSITTRGQLRVDVNVDERSTGKRLWQAWSTTDQGGDDDLSQNKAMVPILVENIGRTVKRQTISLP